MFWKCAKFAATQGALLGWLFTQSLCIWWGFVFNIEGGFPSTRPRWAGSTGKDKYHTLALVALRSFSSSVTVHSVHLPKTTLIGRTRCLRDRLTDRFLMTPLLFTSSNWFSSLYQGKPSDFVILNGQTPQPFWPCFLPSVVSRIERLCWWMIWVCTGTQFIGKLCYWLNNPYSTPGTSWPGKARGRQDARQALGKW